MRSNCQWLEKPCGPGSYPVAVYQIWITNTLTWPWFQVFPAMCMHEEERWKPFLLSIVPPPNMEPPWNRPLLHHFSPATRIHNFTYENKLVFVVCHIPQNAAYGPYITLTVIAAVEKQTTQSVGCWMPSSSVNSFQLFYTLKMEKSVQDSWGIVQAPYTVAYLHHAKKNNWLVCFKGALITCLPQKVSAYEALFSTLATPKSAGGKSQTLKTGSCFLTMLTCPAWFFACCLVEHFRVLYLCELSSWDGSYTLPDRYQTASEV